MKLCVKVMLLWVVSGAASLTGPAALGQERVSDTVHNLSVSGPGAVRAVSERQVCIFCHASHNTRGVRPLWNRELPVSSYRIYESSTLDAQPGQPTGASKLCLSCHDGTIALGGVLSRADRIRISGGDFMPSGMTNLGTDLSDDHPVSFHYTAGLAASDRQLVSPSVLSAEVMMDASGQLQCTSCHDPHSNLHGAFLVKPNEFGALCTTCHQMDGWSAGSHRTSGAAVLAASTADWPYRTVAENACRSCHRAHTAGGRERLLIYENDEDNCLSCHDGQVAGTNIRAELDKFSAHDPRAYQGLHDPTETDTGERRHVECTDCHNPHAVSAQLPYVGYLPIGATLVGARGLSSGGVVIEQAQYEYEVCFRCHADTAAGQPTRIARQAQTSNFRLKFSSTNPSFHPVVVSSPSADSDSLVPSMPRGSMIRCTDCHNNDAGPRAGGGGPDGPHGSNNDFLLERNYNVLDNAAESEYEYALCYKCHQRTSILSDQSFPFHRRHIVDQRTPCSACHDPHGISLTRTMGSDHTHLINFDIQIVQPAPGTLQPIFRDLGRLSGSCTLFCHGVVHDNLTYGPADFMPSPTIERSGILRRRR
jgi:predicted CXXCH cytochrome family protein